MVNFQRLIRNLTRRCDWTESEVARYCGMSQAGISRLKLTANAQPRHDVGEKIIKLHDREMKKR